MSFSEEHIVGKNIPEFRGTNELRRHLLLCTHTKETAIVFGDFGIGKTEIIRSLEDDKTDVICFDLAGVDAPDIMGICMPDSETKTSSYYKSFIINQVNKFCNDSKKDKVILFIDDITNIDKSCQAPLFQLLSEGIINGHKLHEKATIIAAGNHPDHSIVANELPKPLLTRGSVCVYRGPNVDEWLDYANKRNFHPAILTHVRKKNSFSALVNNGPDTFDDDQFLRPRTLEKASTQLYAIEKTSGLLRGFIDKSNGNRIDPFVSKHLASFIGLRESLDIEKTIAMYGLIPDIETICNNDGDHNSETEFDYNNSMHNLLLANDVISYIKGMELNIVENSSNKSKMLLNIYKYMFNHNILSESRLMIFAFTLELVQSSEYSEVRKYLIKNGVPNMMISSMEEDKNSNFGVSELSSLMSSFRKIMP